MSGVVVVEHNAGSLAGAALRGGDLVVKGDVGARTGIDQKGGTILVLGNAASMTAFMMQRGRQIICGDVGPGLGDSMYDGTIYVGGDIASLGIDCVEAEWTADTELVERKFAIYELGSPRTCASSCAGRSSTTTTTSSPASASWCSRKDRYASRKQPTSPDEREVLGRSPIFTPEVINDIHMKAELGRYRMRGFSMFMKMPAGTS